MSISVVGLTTARFTPVRDCMLLHHEMCQPDVLAADAVVGAAAVEATAVGGCGEGTAAAGAGGCG